MNLSEDIVMSVLYAAKKYLVTGLITHCEKFLENQINPTNATVMLEQSIFWEAKALELQCMNIIQQDTQEVFASDAFLHSSDEVMRRILECDVLSVSEVKVFDACISWARMKCQEHDVVESPAALKDMLGDLFYLIRFPTMTHEDFANHVVPMELLDDKDNLKLFMYFSRKDKPSGLPFSTVERITIPNLRVVGQCKFCSGTTVIEPGSKRKKSPNRRTQTVSDDDDDDDDNNPLRDALRAAPSAAILFGALNSGSARDLLRQHNELQRVFRQGQGRDRGHSRDHRRNQRRDRDRGHDHSGDRDQGHDDNSDRTVCTLCGLEQ